MSRPWEIHHGDVRRVCKTLEAKSFDAVLCDPPYGLSFMGRRWDYTVPSALLWSEVLRRLKPGAHAMIFGGSRTFHRLAVAVEDGGFEIRDMLMWLYGSGFPKSTDVSKAIDAHFGQKRTEVVGYKKGTHSANGSGLGDTAVGVKQKQVDVPITKAATKQAAPWQWYGTALKPAHEPIVLARKPIEGTIAETVLSYGTGGLAIDACRISGTQVESDGRWPANIIFDDEAAAMLGDASRFFYTAKADTYQRNSGCEELPMKTRAQATMRNENTRGAAHARAGAGSRHGSQNTHPTVKPVDLIRYLATLILPAKRETPRRILVPFSGSGSEMIGCLQAGWDEVVGIELEAEYIEIAKARITKGGVLSKLVDRAMR